MATGLLIQAKGEVTARALRRIPLPAIVTEFASAASKPATYKRLRRELFGIAAESESEAKWRPKAPRGVPEWWLAADFLEVADRARSVPRLRPGKRGYPDDFYRQVGRSYLRAKRRHPRAPIKALMAEFDRPEPTVHRWLQTARERGFLEPRQEGKR